MHRNLNNQRSNLRRLRRSPHGFLLLIVIGVLAIILTLCLGFLSYTRGQLAAVSHIRDKADTFDIADSAVDYLLANVADKVIDPATQQFRNDCYITCSLGPDGHLWYRPFENGVTANW